MTDKPKDSSLPGQAALYSLEAEEATLGSVLINPGAYIEVAAFLQTEDFYLHKHRWIWEAFVALYDSRQPVDFITVSEELERRNQLAEIGGAAYLTQLINAVPTSLHAEAYARIVEQDAVRRRLMAAATAIAKLAYEEGRDIESVMTDAESTVIAVRAQRTGQAGSISFPEAISEVYDEIKALVANPRDLPGFSTGLGDLDEVTGGLEKRTLFILGGGPGKGKTRLTNQIARFVAQTTGIVYYASEGNRQALVRQHLSALSGVNTRDMQTGRIRDEDWPTLVQAMNDLSALKNFFVCDNHHLTTGALRADLMRLRDEYGVEGFFFDYLEKLADEWNGDSDGGGRSAMISERLVNIVFDLGMFGVVVQRLNKNGFSQKLVGLAGMSGSGQIPHDGDLVAFLQDFYPATDDEARLTERETANIKTLQFQKTRGWSPKKKYVHLVNRPDSPDFGEYAPAGSYADVIGEREPTSLDLAKRRVQV